MPELVVSINAGLAGQGAIAIGNVVGSNIFNIAATLGVAALISPMRVKLQIIRLDAPVMIITSLLFLGFFRDGRISRVEGGLFILGLLLYTGGNLYLARKEMASAYTLDPAYPGIPRNTAPLWLNLLLIAGGFGLLIVGANLLVKGAVAFARLMGVSEAVIGLTIIAAGTSLPELATSVVAAFKREADIAIGNIIGSNIFNILCILGVSASITPLEGAGIRLIDLLVMLGMAILLLPIMKTDFLLDRKEGLVLVAGYAGYVLSLLL
jgi:cation:H+ antiporter